MPIDLKSLLAPTPPAEDPTAKARESLAALKAERAKRAAVAKPKPKAKPQLPKKVEPAPKFALPFDYTAILAEQCKRTLSRFTREAWAALHPNEPLEWSHHHDALCDHLQWLLEGWMRARKDPAYVQTARQLLVNLPPTTLKTEIMMVFAPAWMWIRWPAWRVLCVSCNPRVALSSAVLSRRVIESKWYQTTFQPTWKLLEDQNAKSDFGTTEGGNRQSHGMSATVVGEHADAIFCDDPTDPKEVTRAALEKANADWPSLRNRITDERTSIRVILQQRLDVDDLSGFVTRGDKGSAWLRLSMPMEFVDAKRCQTPMPVDEKNRLCLNAKKAVSTWRDQRESDGELIQPSRYPKEILAELKLNAGPYGWSGQYQQDPTPRGGGKVKRAWLNFFRLTDHHAGDHRRPDGCGIDSRGEPTSTLAVRGENIEAIYLSVDPASKKTESGSLWGLLAVGLMGARRLLLDDRSTRGEWDEILEIIRDMIRTWRPQKLLIEDTAAGPTLIKAIRDEVAAGKIKDANGKTIVCVVQPLTPSEVGGDKEARLVGVINQLAAGLLYLLEGAPWVEEFVNELTLFPNYPTKDRVDALTALLAVTRPSDSLWPEIRAQLADKEARQAGIAVPPKMSMATKLISALTGIPIRPPGEESVSSVPECRHAYVDGKCRLCGGS